jgi:hypothetical protein
MTDSRTTSPVAVLALPLLRVLVERNTADIVRIDRIALGRVRTGVRPTGPPF